MTDDAARSWEKDDFEWVCEAVKMELQKFRWL